MDFAHVVLNRYDIFLIGRVLQYMQLRVETLWKSKKDMSGL